MTYRAFNHNITERAFEALPDRITAGKRRPNRMIETLFEHPFTLNRHLQAPLLKERESFLHYLQEQGTPRFSLRDLSNQMLHVINVFKLDKMRDVRLEEIQKGAKRWRQQQKSNPRARSCPRTASFFIYAAKKWLRFHDRLVLPTKPEIRFAKQLNEFARFLTDELGLSPYSVQSHSYKTSKFLAWIERRRRSLATVTAEDVDEFLALKGADGWSRHSVATAAQALRSFLRYAEMHKWCATGLAKSVQSPRLYQWEGLPEGPSWTEVRQMLQGLDGPNRVRLRTQAILMLLAVYGLRSGEVSRLQLTDLNWQEETFVVRHSKRGGFRRYPLQHEVGDAILEYLKKARPQCNCQHLFVTLNPPYRPIGRTTLWTVTSNRIEALGIKCRRKGPHTLRHARATHLLNRGASLKEIGDMLGHRSFQSIGIYAKVNLRELRFVANLDLGGLL
jgi:site-specific recombinase XerD